MLVRFWGTRGSIPVALTADAVRRKIVGALMAADGRRFEQVQVDGDPHRADWLEATVDAGAITVLRP